VISTVRRALPPGTRAPSLAPVVLALALAACTSGGGSPEVAVPSPDGDAARACRSLSEALPRRVDEQEREALDQDTPYAAVWGDPAIVLRCGVRRPVLLTPGSDSYDPTADAVDVNGVPWLMEEETDGIRFTTTERTMFVEVTVPDDYAPEVNPLADLAGAVDEHIPLDPLYAQPQAH
jgi:uncharacterized protein DUF3515